MPAKSDFTHRIIMIFWVAFSLTPADSWSMHKCKQANGTIAYSEVACDSVGLQSLGTVKIDTKSTQSDASAGKQIGLDAVSKSSNSGSSSIKIENAKQCEDGQQKLDKATFDFKHALASRSEKEAHLNELIRQLNESAAKNIPNIGGSHAIAVEKQSLERLKKDIAEKRYRISSLLGLYVGLCEAAGVKLNVIDAHAARKQGLDRQ